MVKQIERNDLTIGNEVESENGKFKVVDKKRIGKTGRYELTFECLECGKIFSTRTNWKRGKCPQCRKDETTDSYVGQIIKNYKILEFDRFQNGSRFYKVECIQCHDITVKSLKAINSSKVGCKKCYVDKRNITPKIDSVYNCVRSSYITGAKSRNLEWNLSKEFFDNLIQQPCYYCGQEPEYHKSDERFNKTQESFVRNGIDRIDSTKGYTEDNCVACCTTCNRMKLDFSSSDFYHKIKQIYEKHNLDSMCSTTIEKTSEEDGTE